MSDDKSAEDIFETMQEVTHTEESEIRIGSPEWNEYVMSLFSDEELDENKRPLVHGLRRLAQLLLGKIVFSGPTTVFPATSIDHPGRATVVYTVTFSNGVTYSEVADCYIDNTDDFVSVYPVATASTRAEARALRKALQIKSVAAEEVTSKDTIKLAKEKHQIVSASKPTTGEFSGEVLSDRQSDFIDTLCNRASVSRELLLKEIFNLDKKKTVSKQMASEVISLLNNYINKSEEIPESIKV